MTTVNKSLAYIDNTLVYNNDYELLWPEYIPVVLPENTVRVRTIDGKVPRKSGGAKYETATLVPGTTDVYDVYKSGNDFGYLLYDSNNVVEVLGANTTGIRDISYMFTSCTLITSLPLFDTSSVLYMDYTFQGCTSLISVPLFDTSNLKEMRQAFAGCTSLKSVPLFDTSKVNTMGGAFMGCTSLKSVPLFDTSKVNVITDVFENCYAVESGALALYQQVSSQTTPPSYHTDCFKNCGRDTVTGAAELAQIPSSWK